MEVGRCQHAFDPRLAAYRLPDRHGWSELVLELRTTIRRPTSTLAATANVVALARNDVDAMLATVCRRTGLGTHPPLS